MMYKEVEVTTRTDGKYNVWSLMRDPTIEPEVHSRAPYSLKRWVIVDVLKSLTELSVYKAKGVNAIIIPQQKAYAV